jgi:anti-sigma B factor antagonist
MMTVDYLQDEGVAFIQVTGYLDMETAPQLLEMATVASTEVTGTLRIDLSGVNFIDSSGINALVMLKADADRAHRVLVLENPSERVRRVLELTGLAAHFQMK